MKRPKPRFWPSLWRSALLVVLLLLVPATSRGEIQGGGNLLGHRGLLRIAAANGHPAGWIGIGTDFQYFAAGDFLLPGDDHSRLINSYSLLWAPFDFLEGAIALHVISDKNVANNKEQIMVAVGDPELSIKAGGTIAGGFSLGGQFDLGFPSGVGFFEPSFSSTSFLIALLGSWTPVARLPLSVHLNFGFQYDGTSNLFESTSGLSPAQKFAAQLSSFHRLPIRFGIEYTTAYVGPVLEFSLEPFVGGGAPGVGDSPGRLSLGVRVWPTNQKRLQLLAALDLGLTGVGDSGSPLALDLGKDAYVIPRWNLLFRLSYRFDATAQTAAPTGPAPPPPPTATDQQLGVVHGAVVDSKSGRPIWNARLRIGNENVSTLAVDPQDGSFRSYKIPVGQTTVIAEAEGYIPNEVAVQVRAEAPTLITINLSPKGEVKPGTLRGTVKALTGRNPRQTTILIPELDQTIEVDPRRTFSVELKPGEYKVIISAKGFRTQTKRIRVLEGSTVILNVELHR